MFFGTIAGVEARVQELLAVHRTTRFVVLDLLAVTGVDFSAAEAFTRMRRLMAVRGVEMVLSGVTRGGEVGRALRAVGVWGAEGGDQAAVFETLNEALEYAENEFLKALYTAGPAHGKTVHAHEQRYLDVPARAVMGGGVFEPSSPRRTLVQAAAATALRSDEVAQSRRWAGFRQPLPLILLTFQGMTDKNEDFWFGVCGSFEKRVYKAGEVVFRKGVSCDSVTDLHSEY